MQLVEWNFVVDNVLRPRPDGLCRKNIINHEIPSNSHINYYLKPALFYNLLVTGSSLTLTLLLDLSDVFDFVDSFAINWYEHALILDLYNIVSTHQAFTGTSNPFYSSSWVELVQRSIDCYCTRIAVNAITDVKTLYYLSNITSVESRAIPYSGKFHVYTYIYLNPRSFIHLPFDWHSICKPMIIILYTTL